VALFAVGAISTIPLVMQVLGSREDDLESAEA
jgi:hypothetical protein